MNENRKAPAPPRRKRRRRPGKFRRALHALSRAVLLLLLTAAAIVMMTIFFKVNTISVEGAEKYSVEEITNALDISKGDNLYLWNKMKVQEHLLEKLPYLDSVRIRRHLPDALVLTVTECHAAAAVKAEDGSYYYISSTGKILEQSTSDGSKEHKLPFLRQPLFCRKSAVRSRKRRDNHVQNRNAPPHDLYFPLRLARRTGHHEGVFRRRLRRHLRDRSLQP